MSAVGDRKATISVRLQGVAEELRSIQDVLSCGEEIEPRILTDFRDAVNRVRNTAWAVEQYANSKTTDTDPKAMLSLLAGERVRVAYQLFRLIESDLANEEIQFRKGQLMEFHTATSELEHQLATAIGE